MPLFLLKYGKFLLPLLAVIALLGGAKLALVSEYKKGYTAALTAVGLEASNRIRREVAAAVKADRAAQARQHLIRERTRALEAQIPAVVSDCPDLGPDVLRLFNDAITGTPGPAQ